MESTDTITETSTDLAVSERAARTFIRAKQAQGEAKRAYEASRRAVIEAFDIDNVEEVFIDDHKVDVVDVVTRSFDVEKLEALIPATLFRQVVKVSVDVEAFDRAMRDGLIDASIELAVVTPKESVRVDAKSGVVSSLKELLS